MSPPYLLNNWSDSGNVRPDLGPNCLQTLSADNRWERVNTLVDFISGKIKKNECVSGNGSEYFR